MLISKIKNYFADRKAKKEARQKVFDLILRQTVETPIAVKEMTRTIEKFLTRLEETRRQEMAHFQDYLQKIEDKKDLDSANIHKAIGELLEIFGANAKAMTNYFRVETRQAEETLKASKEEATEADLTF